MAIIVGGLAAASGLFATPAPLALINTTSSEPPGLYVRSNAAPGRGRLVAFQPPSVSAQVGDGNLARYASFLKMVAAASGDRVCSDGVVARINGGFAGAVAQTDRQGRALPRWRGCQTLRRDQIFVLSDRVPNSFDSRYYGPLTRGQLIGVYRPLWTAR